MITLVYIEFNQCFGLSTCVRRGAQRNNTHIDEQQRQEKQKKNVIIITIFELAIVVFINMGPR